MIVHGNSKVEAFVALYTVMMALSRFYEHGANVDIGGDPQ